MPKLPYMINSINLAKIVNEKINYYGHYLNELEKISFPKYCELLSFYRLIAELEIETDTSFEITEYAKYVVKHLEDKEKYPNYYFKYNNHTMQQERKIKLLKCLKSIN